MLQHGQTDSRELLRLIYINQKPCRDVFPALDLPLYVQPLWKCCHIDPKHQSAALMCRIAPPTGVVSCTLWLDQCRKSTPGKKKHTLIHKIFCWLSILQISQLYIELHTETKTMTVRQQGTAIVCVCILLWTAWTVWLLMPHHTVPQLNYVCMCMCVFERERPSNTSLNSFKCF